jgi:thymidylate synthase (FAD)
MDSSKGFVRLDSFMADDLSVVNSARVSFAKSSEQIDESGIGLINFLMREQHGTPFEHNAFRFHIKCPIFVAREWFRHRIGSFNEFSARYSEVPNEFWKPEISHVRTQKGKPGAYSFEPVHQSVAEESMSIIEEINIKSYGAYLTLLNLGVAKEMARSVLPVSMYTQFYWTVNARALMNFLSLRTAETAQLEIREYANSVEEIFADKMPITHQAWIKNERKAP